MSQFEDLLSKAKDESQPQLILFMFAMAKSQQETHMGMKRGTIEPVMCVDKMTNELTTFDNLVKEADSHKSDWNFIFVTTLSGKNDAIPSPEEVDPYFRQMTNAVATGEDLSQYIIWDRDEKVVTIS